MLSSLTYHTSLLLAGTPDQLVEALAILRERAEKDEPNNLYSLVNDLSKVVMVTDLAMNERLLASSSDWRII